MDCGFAVDFWGTARSVMDVVVFEGDEVRGAGKEESPVVAVVAGGGPGCLAVDFVVGDGDAV